MPNAHSWSAFALPVSERAPPLHAQPLGGFWKRSFDIAVSILALMALAPIMIAVAALILVTMGRPILHAQTTVGFRGRTFQCYRFRTMVVNARDCLSEHLAASQAARHEWMAHGRLESDPRVTTVGAMLRMSGLNLLPQLVNVLLGHMSFVGPDPLAPSQLLQYGQDASDYIKVRPGVIGFASTLKARPVDCAEKAELDRLYVRTISPAVDFDILVRAVLTGMRANYTSGK